MVMIRLDVQSDVIKTDIREILSADLPWTSLHGKTVAVTGASGMLAAYIVETILALGGVKVVALVRNVAKAKCRFARYVDDPNLEIVCYDCASPLRLERAINVIIHAASLPRPDVTVPVDVLEPNSVGTYYLLEAARQQPDFGQFVFFSSSAVYGEVKGSVQIAETDGSHVDPCVVGNCYSIGKMTGEALCVAYTRQYGIVTKILRYAHTFGPGMDIQGDVRAFSEFFRVAMLGKRIELQTAGTQIRYYCYITDATEAFFRVFFKGSSGEAYNIVNSQEGHSIKDFAQVVSAAVGGTIGVSFCGSSCSCGYAPLGQTAVMSGAKLESLGWNPSVKLLQGVIRTLGAYVKSE